MKVETGGIRIYKHKTQNKRLKVTLIAKLSDFGP